jgi:hypothetical protein
MSHQCQGWVKRRCSSDGRQFPAWHPILHYCGRDVGFQRRPRSWYAFSGRLSIEELEGGVRLSKMFEVALCTGSNSIWTNTMSICTCKMSPLSWYLQCWILSCCFQIELMQDQLHGFNSYVSNLGLNQADVFSHCHSLGISLSPAQLTMCHVLGPAKYSILYKEQKISVKFLHISGLTMISFKINTSV